MKFKSLILLTFIGLFNALLFAQTEKQNTSDYIKHLNTTYSSNPDKAFRLLSSYLKADEKQNKFSIEDLESIYYGLAVYSQRSSSYDSTMFYAKKGLKFLEQQNRKKGKSGFYNLIGVVHLSENKLDSSAHYFIKCIKALKDEEDFGKIPYVNNNIGNIYLDKQDYEQALIYFKRAYIDFDSSDTNNARMLAPIFGNMAFSYFKLDSIKQANKYANLAIQLANNHNQNTGLINGYLTKSDIALKFKKEDSAKLYALKAYHFAEEKEDSYSLGTVAAHLSSLLSKSNPVEAIKYGTIAYNISTIDEERYLANITKILGESYFNANDFKNAAIFQKKYISFQDSIFKSDYDKNTLDILEKYQASQKELKITEQSIELNKK